MLKLLKHEFKSTYLINLILGGVTLIASLIFGFSLKGLQNNENYEVLLEVIGVLFAFVIPLLFASIISIIITIIRSVSTKFYGDLGVLSFIIPVKTSKIVFAKYLANFIWVVFSVIITVISIIFIAISFNHLLPVDIIDLFIINFEFVDGFILLINTLISFLYLFTILFVASTLSYTVVKSPKKILLLVLFYFLFNYAVNIISNALVIIPYAYTSEGFVHLSELSIISLSSINLNLLLYRLVIFGFGAWSLYFLLDKKLEL